MPSNNANKLETDPADIPALRSLDKQKTEVSRKKRSDVLIAVPVERTPEEIKTRVETVLSRIKSEASAIEVDFVELPDSGKVDKPEPAEARVSSSVEQPGTTGGRNVRSITAELERRRAELFALAQGADVRAREAEDKSRETETRLEQEMAQRRLAEQRLRELEEEYLQRLSAAEAEEFKRLDAEMARQGAEDRLKEAESRLKEAELWVTRHSEARAAAENARTDAEAKADAASTALAEFEQRLTEADARARSAEENARGIEALFYEAETITQAAAERNKIVEARLQDEVRLRASAEKRLRALESELSSYLELDLSRIEPDIAPARPKPENTGDEETPLQLKTHIEAEQKARRAAAEARVMEVEKQLNKAEEKHRQVESGLKKVLRKQETELRSLSEQVTRANVSSTALKPGTQYLGEQIAARARKKLVSDGAVITLLLIAILLLIVAVFFRI
ncbi:MAG: hypothetical protein MOB07_18265 [Acidobacteria bacterium]|nr:hypothetical protein [Acidobacteriota bacterium]